MDELIERLRGRLYACHAIRGYLDDAGFSDDGDAHCQLAEIEAALTEAAAALEEAQMALRYAVRGWVLSDEIAWSEAEIDEVVESIIGAAIDQTQQKENKDENALRS